MSDADTLTDAEARVLICARRYGSLWPIPRTGEYLLAADALRDRGALRGNRLTPAGREALARHEDGERRG